MGVFTEFEFSHIEADFYFLVSKITEDVAKQLKITITLRDLYLIGIIG